MSELWIFRGTQPVVWRIPVRVEFVTEKRDYRTAQDYAHLQPAVQLLGVQRVALNNHFRAYHNLICEDGKWSFRNPNKVTYFEHLEKMGASRATSDDPEDHLVWGARRPAGKLRPVQKKRRAWLEDLMARGVGETLEQLEYYWRSFCLHIAHTLINCEQPVDCYFFRLHNCPLRPRWHEEFFWNKIPCEPSPFLKKLLLEPWLLEFDVARECCLRQIELEHKPEWRKLVAKSEFTRRQRLGPEKYAKHIVRSVQRFTPVAWRLHQAWWSEMANSHLLNPARGCRGRSCFVSRKVAGKVRRKAFGYSEISDAAYRNSLLTPRRVSEKVSRKNGRVSKVPHLRPAEEAVWKPTDQRPGPAVDQPRDAARGGDGVLVPVESQKLAPAGEVLAPRAGVDGDGLAGGT